MSSQEKLRQMSDGAFGIMVLTMSLDPFHSPIKKLKRFERMLAEIKHRPEPFCSLTIVDYACGPGRYTIPVADLVGPTGHVIAIDTQHLAIDIVKREALKKNLTNVEAILVDSFDTGLQDSLADIVFLIDAISPIKDRHSLLKEIHRLLKPGGYLLADSSHFSVRKSQAIIQESGLFKLLKTDGKEMVWSHRC